MCRRRDIGLFVCPHFNFHASYVIVRSPSVIYVDARTFCTTDFCGHQSSSVLMPPRVAPTQKNTSSPPTSSSSSSTPSISCRAPSLVARLYPLPAICSNLPHHEAIDGICLVCFLRDCLWLQRPRAKVRTTTIENMMLMGSFTQLSLPTWNSKRWDTSLAFYGFYWNEMLYRMKNTLLFAFW